MSWALLFTRQARKDAQKLSAAGLRAKADSLIAVLHNNPYQSPPLFKKLSGDLAGMYSRRINLRHRLVYEIHEELRTVKILRMWTHYE